MQTIQKLVANPRMVFQTYEEDRVIISIDFKSLELAIGAALSKDPQMNRPFKEPSTLLVDGQEYTNPYSDLHTISAVNCCYPDIFKDQPEHLWVSIAEDASYTGTKTSARDSGKPFAPF